jgi:predicted nucleotide-binding protein
MPKQKPVSTAKTTQAPRTRFLQTDLPSMPLDKALRVARVIAGQYGYKPVTPVQLAKGLDMQTTSGPFRAITGAAVAYGLTKGAYYSDAIALESLGSRIVRPTVEHDDEVAKREALLKPRVIREFLERYDGAAVPREDIAQNVLVDLGVPAERAKAALDIILDGAEVVGLLHEIKGRKYVDLSGAAASGALTEDEPVERLPIQSPAATLVPKSPMVAAGGTVSASAGTASAADEKRARRVFITHGKNMAFVDPIKKLLAFGELEAVVSVDQQSVSQPVPDKVMSDMRSCGAAIIHVDEELRLLDPNAAEHIVLNPNVLIEIGAAMALYGRRFILLVREGVKLPSNLQGLYEVRYSGEQMDSTATIKLLEAIRDIKNHPLIGGAA